MNADGSDDRVVEFSPTSDYEDGAWFSPDGARLSMVIVKGDTRRWQSLTLDGSRPPVSTKPEEDPNAMPGHLVAGQQALILAIAGRGQGRLSHRPDTGDKTTQPWLANWADWRPTSQSCPEHQQRAAGALPAAR
ncbi:MAG: hypothetical protein U0667_00625 [Chloroflexota bacterium]